MACQLPPKMEALVKVSEKESFEFQMVDLPEPTGDEALIKVEAVAVCGSDINLYKWNDVAKVIASLPFTPGHECAGTVVKCGPEATVVIGQRVAVENHFYCGQCYQCKHGQQGISFIEATLLEPLGVSHNAIESLSVQNEDVLVLGCGAIGILAVSVAKALGANRVICADIAADRLKLAKRMGADLTVDSSSQDLKKYIMDLTNGDGIGRICECSGSAPVVNSMFGMLRKGGHVVMVGLPKEPLHIENVLQDIVFKSLTLRTVHGRHIFHTWECCEMLVFSKQVDVNQLVTHKFPLRQFEDAYQELFSGKGCKIVMEPHT